MNRLLHRGLSVASLMSRIPVPLGSAPDYGSASWMIPLVGVAAGLSACAGAGLGVLLFGAGPLAACCALGAQYLAFNLFHLDGLADTADAAGVMGDPDKRRQVLKDPRLGTYGFFAGFLALAFRLGATGGLLASGSAAAWGALMLAPVAGRLAAMVVPMACAPAGGGGLGSALGPPAPAKSGLGYAFAAVPGAVLWGVSFGGLTAAAALLAGAAVAILAGVSVGRWYGAKIGGFTGDALGAAVELGELAVLLASAAAIA